MGISRRSCAATVKKFTKKLSVLHVQPHLTDRIFDRRENLTGHLVHTGPFNTFALFTQKFELLGV